MCLVGQQIVMAGWGDERGLKGGGQTREEYVGEMGELKKSQGRKGLYPYRKVRKGVAADKAGRLLYPGVAFGLPYPDSLGLGPMRVLAALLQLEGISSW